MIYFPCKHCGGEHVSALQLTREQWTERPEAEVTDRCPKRQRVTVYRLRDTRWRDTQ